MKHATIYATTPKGPLICLLPETVLCQRRAMTFKTPFANPVGRAVPRRDEPTFVMSTPQYTICEP